MGEEIIQPRSTLWFQSLCSHVENPSISLPVPGGVYHLLPELWSEYLVYHLRLSLLIDMATLTCIDVPTLVDSPQSGSLCCSPAFKTARLLHLIYFFGWGALGSQESRYQPYFCSLSGVSTTGLPSVLFLSSPSPGSVSHQGLFLVCSCQSLTDVPCCAISSGLIEAIPLKHSLASLLEPR